MRKLQFPQVAVDVAIKRGCYMPMTKAETKPTEVQLIRSTIRGYEDAIRRNTRVEGGALTAKDRNCYARRIVELEGKISTILGSMPW